MAGQRNDPKPNASPDQPPSHASATSPASSSSRPYLPWLEQVLRETPGRYLLVFMHHHVFTRSTRRPGTTRPSCRGSATTRSRVTCRSHAGSRRRAGGRPGTVNDAEGLLAAARVRLRKTPPPDHAAVSDQLLRRTAGEEAVLARELWLLVHPDLQTLRRVRVVAGWLADLCRASERP